MKHDHLSGEWPPFNHDDLQKNWDKLTNEDLEEIQGSHNVLLKKIQERYQISEEAAQQELENWEITD